MFRHIGMYINFAVNTFVATAVLSIFITNGWYAFAVALLLIAGWVGLCMTPFGTWLIRLQSDLRDPSEAERKRIEPIFQSVYRKSAAQTRSLPSDIQWFIHEDDSLNAFAAGAHTVALNTGLLASCRDDEIAAVLAHEFGHIAHRDALATELSVQSNSIAGLAKAVMILLIKLVGIGLSFLFSFVSGDDLMGKFFDLIARCAAWFFNLYISLIYTACTALSYASCRAQEYGADAYAADIGFGNPLIQVLSQFPTQTFSFKAEIAQMLYGTHPKSEDRIQRLKEQLQTVSI